MDSGKATSAQIETFDKFKYIHILCLFSLHLRLGKVCNDKKKSKTVNFMLDLEENNLESGKEKH